jgi:hypothetical protein
LNLHNGRPFFSLSHSKKIKVSRNNNTPTLKKNPTPQNKKKKQQHTTTRLISIVSVRGGGIASYRMTVEARKNMVVQFDVCPATDGWRAILSEFLASFPGDHPGAAEFFLRTVPKQVGRFVVYPSFF